MCSANFSNVNLYEHGIGISFSVNIELNLWHETEEGWCCLGDEKQDCRPGPFLASTYRLRSPHIDTWKDGYFH